jgi:hypothetical protein
MKSFSKWKDGEGPKPDMQAMLEDKTITLTNKKFLWSVYNSPNNEARHVTSPMFKKSMKEGSDNMTREGVQHLAAGKTSETKFALESMNDENIDYKKTPYAMFDAKTRADMMGGMENELIKEQDTSKHPEIVERWTENYRQNIRKFDRVQWRRGKGLKERLRFTYRTKERLAQAYAKQYIDEDENQRILAMLNEDEYWDLEDQRAKVDRSRQSVESPVGERVDESNRRIKDLTN